MPPYQKDLLWPPPQGQSSLVESGLASLPEGAVYLRGRGEREALLPNSRTTVEVKQGYL